MLDIREKSGVAFRYVYLFLMVIAVASCSRYAGTPGENDGLDAGDIRDGFDASDIHDGFDAGDIRDGSDAEEMNDAGGGDFECIPSVELSVIPSDHTDRVLLQAQVFEGEGIKVGEGVEVDFTTDLGRFLESESLMYITHTDENGVAFATFLNTVGQVCADANVAAGVYLCNKNAYDDIELNVRPLGYIMFVSAVPEDDRGAIVTFVVGDADDNPWPNVLVTFTSPAPGVNLFPTTDRSDENGEVQTSVNKGNGSTTMVLTATAQLGCITVSAESPPI